MKQSYTQVFTHPEIGELKGVIGKDGEPWFLAGDVCRSLGLKNTSQSIAGVVERYKIADIKGIRPAYTLIETAGGKQNVQIIPEQLLYELAFKSRKQRAIKFSAWVTSEVLPALRKHGEYRMEGKMIRRKETDSIQKLVEYAQDQGSESAERYYTAITRMTNKFMGIEAGQRDTLDADTLQQITILETVVDMAIKRGIAANLPYKDIYKHAKQSAESVLGGIGL